MIVIPKQKYEAVLERKEEQLEENKTSKKEIMEEEMKTKNISTDILKEENYNQKQRKDEDNIETLINISIPTKYKDKLKNLLQYLKQQPGFHWNKRGEVIINNDIIKNSHIIDWLRDIVIPTENRHPPEGIHHFYQYLKSIHIPMSIISSSKRNKFLLCSKNSGETDEEEIILKTTDEKDHRKNRTEKIKRHVFVKRDISALFPSKTKKKWLRFKL